MSDPTILLWVLRWYDQSWFILLETSRTDLFGLKLLGIFEFICFVGESKNGLGRHYQVVAKDNQEALLHWEFVHSLVSLFGLTMVKISVSLLLLRIATQRAYRIFLWILIGEPVEYTYLRSYMLITWTGFLTSYTLMCAFTLVFACLPVSAAWNTDELATAKCFSVQTFVALGITNSVCNMFSDSLLAVIPIPMILRLQLNARAKIALSMILALGFVYVQTYRCLNLR